MQIDPKEIKDLIDFAYFAHQERNTNKDFRQDGKVPFFTHPMWCALTLLQDSRVPFEERMVGYQALLLHDVLEDTSANLPNNVPEEVVNQVKEMTYDTWEEEKNSVPHKSPFIKLLKLIDKTATMYDEAMRKGADKKKREWRGLMEVLVKDVEEHYGNIRTVSLAKATLQDTDW